MEAESIMNNTIYSSLYQACLENALLKYDKYIHVSRVLNMVPVIIVRGNVDIVKMMQKSVEIERWWYIGEHSCLPSS